MNTERFLAFKRSGRHGRASVDNPVELEVGVQYDTALAIDQKNNWLEVGELDSAMVEELIKVASRGVNELVLFCFNGQKLGDRKGRGLRTAIRRFIAIAWLLNSNELKDLHGRPMPLQRLAKLPQVRCTRCALSLLAQKFGDQWGFRARVQKMKGTKPNYAEAAKSGWEVRRQRAALLKEAGDLARLSHDK